MAGTPTTLLRPSRTVNVTVPLLTSPDDDTVALIWMACGALLNVASSSNVVVVVGNETMSNVAVTFASDPADRMHEPVPVQSPDQPAKTEPGSGVATSSGATVALNPCAHTGEQLIADGMLVTRPVPAPPRVTVTRQHVSLSRMPLSQLNS